MYLRYNCVFSHILPPSFNLEQRKILQAEHRPTAPLKKRKKEKKAQQTLHHPYGPVGSQVCPVADVPDVIGATPDYTLGVCQP